MYDHKMTNLERLKLQKEIDQRNEYRRREFANMKVEQEEKYMLLVDLYVYGEITKEELHRYIKKLRSNETTEQETEEQNN